MTYSVTNLNEEQMKAFIKAFSTQFLMEPLKKPNRFKSLPNGFRPQKLSRAQIEAAYVKEVTKYGTVPIIKYLEKDTEANFIASGVAEAIENIGDTVKEILIGGCKIEELLGLYGINTSAELAFALGGKEYPEDIHNALIQIHESFTAIGENIKKLAISEAAKVMQPQVEEALADAQMQSETAKTLEKSLNAEQAHVAELENALKDLQGKVATVKEEKKSLCLEADELKASVKSLQTALDKAEKAKEASNPEEWFQSENWQKAMAEYLAKNEPAATRIMMTLIEEHNEFTEKFIDAAGTTWKTENESELRKVQEELCQVTEDLDDSVAALTAIQEQEKGLKAENESLASEKERLKSETKELEERLLSLRADVDTAQKALPTIQTSVAGAELFYTGHKVDENPEDISKTSTLISIMTDNLECAGVGAEHREMLAAYLCAFTRERIPLILAGPRGHNIADAMSITLCNRTAAHLKCVGEWNEKAAIDALASDDLVIAVDNPLDSRWVGQLLPAIQCKKHVFVLLLPLAEELSIEPGGIYDYALPILTNLFVTEEPSEEWVGGIAKESVKRCASESKFGVRYLKLSQLAQQRANAVRTNALAMNRKKKEQLTYLCQLLPLALNLGEKDWLIKKIEEDIELTENDKKTLLELCGANGE